MQAGGGGGPPYVQLPSLNGGQEVFLAVFSPALIVQMLCLGELKVSSKNDWGWGRRIPIVSLFFLLGEINHIQGPGLSQPSCFFLQDTFLYTVSIPSYGSLIPLNSM